VENLRPAGEATQLALDLTGSAKAAPAAADQAIDALVARFGEAVVRPASLLSPAALAGPGGRHRPRGPAENPATGQNITNRGNLPANPSS
jgi:hypothetical protein